MSSAEITSGSPLAWLVVASIRVYQVIVSPWLGPACRFEPTCSRYAVEAIERYGIPRGVWLSVRRLGRCHPLGESGFDPVP